MFEGFGGSFEEPESVGNLKPEVGISVEPKPRKTSPEPSLDGLRRSEGVPFERQRAVLKSQIVITQSAVTRLSAPDQLAPREAFPIPPQPFPHPNLEPEKRSPIQPCLSPAFC